MAIVSAAISAVAAAIAATSFATVATAAVAVSTVIGVAGLATTAIGMITGNKDLLKAGKIMGYVGLAGGLTGGLIGGIGGATSGLGFVEGAADAFAGASQHLSNAWDSGVGSLFSGAPASVAPPVGPVGTGTVLEPATSGVLGTSSSPYVLAPTADAASATSNAGFMSSLTQSADDAIGQAGVAANNLGQPLTAAGQIPESQALYDSYMTSSVGGPGTDSGTAAAEKTVAKLGEEAAGAGISGPGSTANQLATPETPFNVTANANNLAGLNGIPKPTDSTDILSWFKNLPPALQASLAITGGQGLAGFAGGYFQGLSAEKRLQLEQLINEQNQAQRQWQNKNASYAPKVNYKKYTPPSGLMNTAKGTA